MAQAYAGRIDGSLKNRRKGFNIVSINNRFDGVPLGEIVIQSIVLLS